MPKSYSEKQVGIGQEYAIDTDIQAYGDNPLCKVKELAEKDEFDILLVYSYACLGRDGLETPLAIEWFLNNGTKIWSVLVGDFIVLF